MKKWNLIDQTTAPDGQVISLHEHDGTYGIRAGAAELMSTRNYSSEEKLAELACEGLQTKRQARVLIGGLGMGFTLKAALACLAPDAVVVVAEILEAVIAWNRNPAFPLAGAAMNDVRVTVRHQDVREAIREAPRVFHSILLDVDNGPAALTTEGNARLYDNEGLRATREALQPGGCAAFWSAAPDHAFEVALQRAGFRVTTHRCRAHGHSGRSHMLFVGRVGG